MTNFDRIKNKSKVRNTSLMHSKIHLTLPHEGEKKLTFVIYNSPYLFTLNLSEENRS